MLLNCTDDVTCHGRGTCNDPTYTLNESNETGLICTCEPYYDRYVNCEDSQFFYWGNTGTPSNIVRSFFGFGVTHADLQVVLIISSVLILMFVMEIIPDLINRQFAKSKRMPFFWSKITALVVVLSTFHHELSLTTIFLNTRH